MPPCVCRRKLFMMGQPDRSYDPVLGFVDMDRSSARRSSSTSPSMEPRVGWTDVGRYPSSSVDRIGRVLH